MYGLDSVYEILENIQNAFTANFVLTLVGAVAAVVVGAVLHKLVFGPKSKDPNADKISKFANGQHFLPAGFIKGAYYAGAVYLLFLGISLFPLFGFSAINAFIGISVFGNVVLRIAYELVMAARKNAGIDIDNKTAEEPKVEPVKIPVLPPQPQYQQPGQFAQPQYRQPAPQQYQQPVPQQYQQPAQQQYQQPAPQPQYQQSAPAPQQYQQPAPVQNVQAEAPVQTAAPVQAEAPQAAVCPGCGNPVKPGAKFCAVCGKPLN